MPALMAAFNRISSGYWLRTAVVSPINGASSGQVPGFSMV